MTTQIPLIVFEAITQTSSSPEATAASLNEAEATAFKLRRRLHGNARRVYPFWKICQVCSRPFPCATKEQVRNQTCGKACWRERSRRQRQGKPLGRRAAWVEVSCERCGASVERRERALQYSNRLFCSHRCRGLQVTSERDMAAVGALGRSGWTEASRQSYLQKMTGPNNPAWKGGVTYFRKCGNYPPIKYVRCPLEFVGMARKDGYVMEHRLLVAQALARPLLRSEVVHHCNHDPTDNRLVNLAFFASNSDHKRFEHHGSPAPIWSGSSPSTT